MHWFSVRSIIKHEDNFEERITLWRALSFEHALVLAEAESRDYAETLSAGDCGLYQAYDLGEEEQLTSGAEVFSLMRRSVEPAEVYLSRFFDTGAEIQKST